MRELIDGIRNVFADILQNTMRAVPTSIRKAPPSNSLCKLILNPSIGGISKKDLARFLRFAMTEFNLPVLESFLKATPTAELEPITSTYTQSDEADMGCTYAELSAFGRLRKINKLGPYSMWQYLCNYSSSSSDIVPETFRNLTPREIFNRVKFLWHCFGINRHKQEVLTPSLHAETYSPDSNRYDLLPFLRPTLTWAYGRIENALGEMEKKKES